MLLVKEFFLVKIRSDSSWIIYWPVARSTKLRRRLHKCPGLVAAFFLTANLLTGVKNSVSPIFRKGKPFRISAIAYLLIALFVESLTVGMGSISRTLSVATGGTGLTISLGSPTGFNDSHKAIREMLTPLPPLRVTGLQDSEIRRYKYPRKQIAF
jgi:hypothetical protein